MPFFIVFGILIIGMFVAVYKLTGSILFKHGINIKKRSVRALRFLVSALVFLLCALWRTGLIIILHLLVIFYLTELATLIVRRFVKLRKNSKAYSFLKVIYRFCIIPVLIVVLVLGYGYYNMNHIVRTDYQVTSNKLSEDYRVILITDTHYDTVQNTDLLKEKISEINSLNPDIVLLGGDIVEEGTSKASMNEVFEVLGGIKSRYGSYYVYGNHDRQLYSTSPEYTVDELNNAITSKGIKILRDEQVLINNDLALIGREDISVSRGSEKRADTKELLETVPKERFILVMDHQPLKLKENASQGVDLQLSGHTHGGQIFPLGTLGDLFGVMHSYGEYQEENTKLIVSSGFTGWGFSVRTEKNCEYVVVDLKKQ